MNIVTHLALATITNMEKVYSTVSQTSVCIQIPDALECQVLPNPAYISRFLKSFLAPLGLVGILWQANSKMKLEVKERNWMKCLVKIKGSMNKGRERIQDKCDPSEGEGKGRNI